MRLLITFILLAFLPLHFTVANASPQTTTLQKTKLTALQKKKLQEQAGQTNRVTLDNKKKRTAITLTRKQVEKTTAKKVRAGHSHMNDENLIDRNAPIRMNPAHQVRYQKAHQTAMNKLMGQLGKPYLWGGASPETGFDCSGLVWYAYKDLLKTRIPRTANEMYQFREASPVRKDKLERGDLVFFRINGRGSADHVGVYLGQGKFIQSPRTGKDIQISQLADNYWQKHYVGARRVMTPQNVKLMN